MPAKAETETDILPLQAEEIAVSRHRSADDTVRVAVVTRERKQPIDEELTHERVSIERVPIGRPVDAAPPVREEGDTTILSVVEEKIVVERRLILKEEVHIRRLRMNEHHRETVMLRAQEAVVTRAEAGTAATPDGHRPLGERSEQTNSGALRMNEQQTLVAVYDTSAHADAAVRDLKSANVADSSIHQHAKNASASGTASSSGAAREPGFWAKLFGTEPDHDENVYDRSIDSGSTVVTVRAPDDQFDRISAILEKHQPVDLDARAAQYGSSETTTTRTTAQPATGVRGAAVSPGTGARGAAHKDNDTMELAEESLAVGKRDVGGGGTRIRRYSVAKPVEEQVSLRTEKVAVDRRPVTDGRPVADGNFADKTIEMQESSEQAVVSKNARVKEEVSLRKEASDRVETVKDTVRHDEAEVEKVPGKQSGTRPAASIPTQRGEKVVR